MLTSFAATARADDRTVTVVLSGDEAERSALALVVSDLLVRLGVSLELGVATSVDRDAILDRPRSFDRALARVWIDLAPTDHATLYLVDGPWERVLIRRVRRDPAHLEVEREELGHILETAVEAMLAGARIGLDRSALVEPKPAPPAHEPPRLARPVHASGASVVARLGVFEQLTFGYASELPVVHAFGLSAAIEGTSGARLGAWLTAGYRWPARTSATAIGVEVQGLEARALARVTAWSSGSLRVDFGLGAGVDVLGARGVVNRPGHATLTPASFDASLIVRFATGLRWRSILALWFALDADATGRQYPFEIDGREATALTPRRLRPVLLLEGSFP